jgi:hypothetical protein
MKKRIQLAMLTVLFLGCACWRFGWAQYLGPVGSFRTPIQNQMRAAPMTGVRTTVVNTGSGCSPFASCGGASYRDMMNSRAPASYLPRYNITGQDMAGYAVHRGITRGMRF